MKILADSSLPGLEAAFPKPFILTQYSHQDELSLLLTNQDILLCRANLKVNQYLLNNHQLKFVATASSGTDHLDHVYLNSQGIRVVDAKGCNAVSVADYVTSTLACMEHRHLIKGNKAGIIGMGQVGTKVFNRLHALGFQIKTYDPLRGMRDKHFQSCKLSDLFDSDVLCIHAELHDTVPYASRDLINHNVLSQLKPGCIIINAARGGILNEEALLNAKQSIIYCTDVFLHEPDIDKRIVEKATLCTPHIAGHSLEAKYDAVALISKQIHQLMLLPEPQFAQPEHSVKSFLNDNKSWSELILSIYNPQVETEYLKQASNVSSAFLTLRKNHQFRHNFSFYAKELNHLSAEINKDIFG